MGIQDPKLKRELGKVNNACHSDVVLLARANDTVRQSSSSAIVNDRPPNIGEHNVEETEGVCNQSEVMHGAKGERRKKNVPFAATATAAAAAIVDYCWLLCCCGYPCTSRVLGRSD